MNYKHYTFSNEVKLQLLEFYKLARSKEPNSNKRDLWQLLLPQNQPLLDELGTMQTVEVIDLIDDETSSMPKESADTPAIDNIKKVDIDEPTINDIVESVKERLDFTNILEDRLVLKLADLSDDQMYEVFTKLADELDSELCYKFGNNILDNNLSQVRIVEAFIKFVVVPKLFVEHNVQIHTLFVSFLNSFSELISKELALKFEETIDSTKCIQENLSGLNVMQKQKLLREFVGHSTKLTKAHYPVIDCLLLGEMELEPMQKLIGLLTAASSSFSNDKTFGKMLLNFVSRNKMKIGYFEQQLTHIVNLHRSVWKSKLSRVLGECTQSNMSLSESMRF